MTTLRRLLTVVGATILIVAASLLFVTGTGPGRAILAGFISDMASGAATTIRLEGLAGLWSGPLTVARLEIGDAEGVWLTIEDLAVDLDRPALFRPALVASSVSAGLVDVVRRPVPGETTENGGGGLPLELDIAGIDLPDIRLGAPLAGEPARLAASGQLRAATAPLDIVAAADIRRIDDREGRIAFDLAFAPEADRLVLDVEAEEPAGGVVVSLLGIPGAPKLALTAEGEGSLDDFQADLAVALGGQQTVSGNALIGRVAEGRNVVVNLDGQLAPFVSQALRPLLAGTSTIGMDIVIGTGGEIAINRALVESATARLDTSGRFDRSSGAVALDFEAMLADAGTTLRIERADGPPVRIGHTTASGTVSGTMTEADITLDLDSEAVAVDGKRIDGLAARISATGASLSPRVIPFGAEIAIDSIVTANDTADAALAGAVRIALAGTLSGGDLTLTQADVVSDPVTLAASGRVDLADAATDLAVTAEVRPVIDHAAARWLAGEPATVSASIVRTGDGDLAVDGIALSSALADASGKISLTDGQIDGTLSVEADDLSAVADDISGGVSLTASLGGSIATPSVEITGQGRSVVVRGESLEDLAFAADIVADRQDPRGEITVDASYRGQPLKVEAKLAPDADGAPRADPILIRIADAVISGSGVLTPEGPVADLDVSIPDLTVFNALLLREDLAGRLEGKLGLSSENGSTDLTARLTSGRIEGFGIAARDLSASGGVKDVLGERRPQGKVLAEELMVAGTAIAGLEATADLQNGDTRFTVKGETAGIPLDLAGTLKTGETMAIALERARASFRGVEAQLAAPTTVDIVNGRAQLDDVRLEVGGGTVAVSGIAGGSLDLDVRLSGVAAGTVDNFAPGLGLSGTVSGTVSVEGPAGDPTVEYDLDATGLSTAATRAQGLPALGVGARGTYGQKSVSLDASVGGPGGLTFSVGGNVGLAGAPAPDLKIEGTVPFSLLAARLASSGLRLTGSANADLTVGGTASDPEITGTVTTTGATFVDTRSNLVLRDLSARTRFTGDSLVIEEATAAIAAGGRVRASGTIGLDPGLPADLSVTVTDGRYSDGRIVSAEFSAEITVTGPLATRPVLGGTVSVSEASVTLPEKVPGGIDVVAVEHRNAPADVRAQAADLRASSGGGGSALQLDLSVIADRRIFVRGRGIDAELGGRLQLTGPASAPQAVGRFNLVRGRMNVLGRRLDFSKGSIGFSGSMIPRIDFAATSQTSGATVSLNLTGSAADPEVSVTSSPELPEEEALALLIYDRSAGSLSPVQIAQLADALTALGNGGTSILGELRDTLGVDNIDITTDEDGEAAVAVGRYINDRTYLGVKQGAEPGSTRVTIDLDITDDIKVRGETGANGTTKGGIFFERDY